MYEACWWPERDARNRRWVEALLPLLDAHEDALRARLAELYGRDPARWLPVDVVGYADADGGSTVLNPHQLFVSSANIASQDYSALEALLRETSHTMFGVPAPGALWQALQQAANTAAKPVPDDFLHLLRFFTTDEAVRARLAEHGVPHYDPYVSAEGLLERSEPAEREALEHIWQRTSTAESRWQTQ